MQIHLIGAGKMGLPIARHLAAGGHSLTVHDTQAERLAAASQAGLRTSDAVEEAEVLVTSLPHDAALLAVGEALARRARPGAIWLDTSTVSPAASAQAAELCAGREIAYVRSALSGNSHMAEAAQLTVIASGPRAAYDTVLPLFRLLGPAQFYVGEAEQARLMKLVVNLMVVQTSAMLAEALALGRKGGLQWEAMWQVLAASAIASPLLKAKAGPLSQRDFTPTFTVEQMVKDVGLILGEAAATHVPLPQTAATLQLLHSAIAQGHGQDDYAAILKTVEQAAGMA